MSLRGKTAQQSVHRTAGTLRVFGAGSERWWFSVSSVGSPQPPVTQAVGQLHRKGICKSEIQVVCTSALSNHSD
jgi:hypothetical protein